MLEVVEFSNLAIDVVSVQVFVLMADVLGDLDS